MDDSLYHVSQQIRQFNEFAMLGDIIGMKSILKMFHYNIDNVDEHGNTALHLAADSSSPRSVEFILSKVKYANVIDNKGNSPLMIAADRGSLIIFRMIVDKISLINGESSPSDVAMFPTGLHSTIHVKRNGQTLLMIACGMSTDSIHTLSNSEGVVEFLIGCGFSPQTKDHKGRTALHHAAESVRRGIHFTIDILLRSVTVHKLSYVEMKDDNGMTALQLACREGDENDATIVKLLSIPGININVVDVDGRTILHECVRRGLHDVIERLIKLGMNIHVRDIGGETAVELSERLYGPIWYKADGRHCLNVLRREHNLSKERWDAISMAEHERLGAGSLFRLLDTDTIRGIKKQT